MTINLTIILPEDYQYDRFTLNGTFTVIDKSDKAELKRLAAELPKLREAREDLQEKLSENQPTQPAA